MKDPLRRDTILTVIGLILMIVFFLFAVYLPGQKACEAARSEIRSSEQTIEQIPSLVSELESQNRLMQECRDYVASTAQLVPDAADTHSVIHDVAQLARECDLTVNRLEPLQSVEHQTYLTRPFRLVFSGQFARIVEFLHGLETSERLSSVQTLQISGDNRWSGQDTQGQMDFVVYARRNEKSDSSENTRSGDLSAADKQ